MPENVERPARDCTTAQPCDEEASLGLRERKKRATRAALQLTALQLVTDRGLDHVTVEDITEEVGVSPRTFFNYFATKEEALIGADPDLLPTLTAALRARPAGESPLTALREVLLTDAERIAGTREIWRLRMALGAQHPELFHTAATATARIDSALAQVIAERTGTDPDRDPLPRLVTGAASATRRTALHMWARGNFREPYPEVLARCFDEFTTLMSNS